MARSTGPIPFVGSTACRRDALVISGASIALQFNRASGDREGTLADATLAGSTRSHQPCKTAVKTGLLLKGREYCRSPSASWASI